MCAQQNELLIESEIAKVAWPKGTEKDKVFDTHIFQDLSKDHILKKGAQGHYIEGRGNDLYLLWNEEIFSHSQVICRTISPIVKLTIYLYQQMRLVLKSSIARRFLVHRRRTYGIYSSKAMRSIL